MVAGGVITWILIADGVGDISFRMSNELQPLYLQQIYFSLSGDMTLDGTWTEWKHSLQ